MTELVADYEAPSGILDQPAMDALEANVERSLGDLGRLALDTEPAASSDSTRTPAAPR
jgi:hypothetical protein